MTNRDRLLGITVALLWGLNFLAIRAGLDRFPPFFFVALRFLVIAVPVVLFVPRPNVPLRWLLLYGTGFGVLQFTFLFWAMSTGMPTGLASLVLQASAPMTVLLGALLLGERVSRRQVIGIVVAVGGMVAIGWDRFAHASLLPLLLTLCGAFGWALGNIGSKQARTDSPMRLMLWMTVVPPLPMLALSAAIEGPTAGWSALGSSFDADGLPALAGLVYIVVLGTIVGSGLWTGLMSRYPASTVAPFSLLVPVVGIAASWLVLGEQPTVAALCGGVVVVGGCLYGLTRPRATDPTPTVSLPTPVPARV
ncbi:Amino acid ABC transporter [Rhodococcus sp. RD6.2]|jgi:O-acetylserine/cysteine efflux transporter|uniref:EamA family transporter n=1 Tax=Rhodococcus sp. RD6.2 TaxID=260936 RepID=UPI00063B5B96|nr:EamA family transporter [Rhodococcus sp. RD6.2]CRK54500.1 Amino acid ABC transporter [Rhodococcus sp. RD6.2]